jgi:hypothetical protein
LKQRAAELLHLIHQKGQHHEMNKNRRKVLLAQPVVMTKVISLILQGVKSFINGVRVKLKVEIVI